MKKRYVLLLVFVALLSQHLSAQLSASVDSTNPTCVLGGTARATASGAGGYTYKWSNGSTTDSVSGLSAGAYSVTVYSNTGTTTWDSVYLETFDSTVQTWNTNISTGANGNANNYWDISDSCIGNGAIGSCVNNTYSPAGGSNKSLYITARPNTYGIPQFAGARYDAGGAISGLTLCSLGFCTGTNMAAQSPNISTTGVHNLVLSFQYTAGGIGLSDNASLLYSINGGTSFTVLDPSLKSNNSTSCNADGDEEGTWAYSSYVLPQSCNNIANLIIRFNWTNDGLGDAGATDPSIAVDNVTLRDSIPGTGGVDSVVKIFTLSNPTHPIISTSALVVTNASCGQSNGSITGIAIHGGRAPYTWAWKNSGGIEVSAYYNLNGVPAGTYNFFVTDANGCTVDTSLVVGSISGPSIVTAAVVERNATCGQSNGSITGIGATGGQSPYNVEWKNSSNAVVSGSYALSTVPAGTYTFEVTDANSCVADTTLVVGASAGPTIVASGLVVQSATCNQSNGSITGLGITGGRSPYNVEWENSSSVVIGSNYSLSGVASGTYTFVVTDANSCTADTSIVVGVNGGPVIVTNTLAKQNATCGLSNGAITGISVTGGHSPYSVEWKNSSNTVVSTTYALGGVPSGTYTFVATDANSCMVDSSLVIGGTPGPAIVATNMTIKRPTCGLNNGSISGIVINAGSPPFTVKWVNTNGNITVSQTDSVFNLGAGRYSFTVTDSNGCSADTFIDLIAIQGPAVPVVSAAHDTICSGDVVSVCSSPQNYAHYLWSNGDTTSCITSGAGLYSLTVTDTNGCVTTANSFTLDTFPALAPAILASGDTLTATGGIGSYQWYYNGQAISGATNAFYVANQSGNYQVKIIDANNCNNTSSDLPFTLLGISNMGIESEVKIYPNPVSSGAWHIIVSEQLLGATCHVFDADGRAVYKIELKNQDSEIEPDLTKGVYAIQIISIQGNYTLKLIKL